MQLSAYTTSLGRPVVFLYSHLTALHYLHILHTYPAWSSPYIYIYILLLILLLLHHESATTVEQPCDEVQGVVIGSDHHQYCGVGSFVVRNAKALSFLTACMKQAICAQNDSILEPIYN